MPGVEINANAIATILAASRCATRPAGWRCAAHRGLGAARAAGRDRTARPALAAAAAAARRRRGPSPPSSPSTPARVAAGRRAADRARRRLAGHARRSPTPPTCASGGGCARRSPASSRPTSSIERRRATAGCLGEELEATVLFADLRGFTTRGRGAAAPSEVIALLDRYLSDDERRDPRPRRHRRLLHGRRDHGRVRRARSRSADHADRALAAAREMLGRGWRRSTPPDGVRDGHRDRTGPGDVGHRRLGAAAWSTRRSATPPTPPPGWRR